MRSLLHTRGVFHKMANFLKCDGGNFALIIALLAPVFLSLFGLVFDAGRLISEYSQSKRVIAMACERSTKPTRTMTPDDSSRRQSVLNTFDRLVLSSKQKVVSRDAQIDWLTTNIQAKFTTATSFASLFGIKEVTYSVSYTCVGIPPYPHDGEVVLSSSLTKPDGSALQLKYSNCWGVYKPTDFGWDGGDGPGIEVQNWGSPACRSANGWTGLPPSDFPSPYALELDSDWEGKCNGCGANSSMYKYIELHPGSYEISMWYNGRNPAYEGSNEIDMYLQATRPSLDQNKLVLQMRQAASDIHWQKYSYKITVSRYSIYKLTLAAGAKSDTVGGIITSFQVKYLDTL